MYRLLILEDMEGTLKQLRAHIMKEIPNSVIDVASTVADSHTLLKTAADKSSPYDAAILDFWVPVELGDDPQADDSICRDVTLAMPETLVIHITAYPEKPEVDKHMEDFHGSLRGIRGCVIDKARTGWVSEVLKTLKEFLYGTAIRERMEAIFGTGTEARHRPDSPRVRSSRGPGGGIHELHSLFRDISTHWKDLDESLQSEIQATFHVNPDSDPVYVGFIGDVSKLGGE
jgi:hypothetical protein